MKREELLQQVAASWDVIVIGGGITGAGIFYEASRRGYRTLLIEQRDFSWGTSSRSGKLVHGGLRYLKQGQFKTTWESVRERERLLKKYSGMVESIGFLVPFYEHEQMKSLLMKTGLMIYDSMAMRYQHSFHDAHSFSMRLPSVKKEGMVGGYCFMDAVTDDARLVLRMIQAGVSLGGTAMNYVSAKEFLTDQTARVRGVLVQDETTKIVKELQSQVVINATGVWLDELSQKLGYSGRLRKLRGSHIIFPGWRFPLAQAVSLQHPIDKRHLYAIPWEGVTLLGTTDIDHDQPLSEEPRISQAEGGYLLEAVQAYFPSLHLSGADAISTFSGVRPVIDTGKKDPSKESRDHLIWSERGVVHVTGGKLTTFELLARKALREAKEWIAIHSTKPVSEQLHQSEEFPPPSRIQGRYGEKAAQMTQEASGGDLSTIKGTNTLWLEVRWALRHEWVVHLDDLLLRRTRLGLILPDGASRIFNQLRSIVQSELGWEDQRWEEEVAHYQSIWKRSYSPSILNS